MVLPPGPNAYTNLVGPALEGVRPQLPKVANGKALLRVVGWALIHMDTV
jgi:hypothetical protein